MAQGYRVGQDIGGFGRLASAELTKRREARLDVDADRRAKLGEVQLKQAESNLAEMGRKKKLRDDIGLLMQDIPEGENKFSAPYKYMMEQGETEYANQYMNQQSKMIDSVYRKNPEAGAKLFNDTIGRVMGTTITPVSKTPGKDDIVKADQNGKTVYLKRGPSGFVPYDIPENVTIEELNGEQTPTDEKLEYWARQKIKTGKKVFNVRGKYANRMNALIEDMVAKINLAEGVTGEEAAFQQEDIKGIQKSIAAQEKQRGSMGSFVINIDKQIDEIGKVADELSRSDIRLFNKPINWASKKIAGDPTLSKYNLYLSELQREVSKLSQGATGSVAQLSDAEQRHWASIMDENLSVKDMLELLESVRTAGRIRMESVDEALVESRKRLRSVGSGKPKGIKKKLKYNMHTGGFE